MNKRTDGKNGHQSNASRKKSGGSKNRILTGFLIVALVLVVGIGVGFLTATINTKPNLSDIRPPASSQIYDVNKVEIATVHAAENRVPVKLADVPTNLQNAFVAVEDARFYDHHGIDFIGIMRAVVVNLTNRGVSEGGSTITQQLAKNAYLTQDRTLHRKIQEVFLALQLEQKYTKQEILESYLNQIYFGQGAYGVQAAAKTYFNKDVKDLDLNECAMLAGIPKSPNYYSPFVNLTAAKDRKSTVLDQMEKYGYISSSTAKKTKAEELQLAKPSEVTNDTPAAYFIDYVTQIITDELGDKFGNDAVYKDGLKIYTTLDLDMQNAAEEAMQQLPTFSEDENGIKQPQCAIVAVDPNTGHIKAMVGGRGTDQFNRATMAERQPGSAFKPFVFATALEKDYSPSSVIDDTPYKNDTGWNPQNYDRQFHGKVTLRQVAVNSLNVPTIKIAEKVGIKAVLNNAENMGITTLVKSGSPSDENLATALGGLTRGVTPLELTAAYGTFANGGNYVKPVAILAIEDRDGKVVYRAPEPDPHRVLKKETANQLTSMLMDAVQYGTGAAANIGRPMAGKTGTTNDSHDAWFVGYTPDIVAGIWIGNDNNTSLGSMTGGTVPARLWKIFMQKAVKGIPAKGFDGATATSKQSLGTVTEEDKDADKKDGDKADKDGKKDGKKDADGKKSKPTEGTKQQPATVPEPTTAPTPGGDADKGRT